jgi:GxxExxY protein
MSYYEVWNHTARLYPEVIYERCMQGELAPHLPYKRQDAYEIFYKNIKVGGQRLDMFLADEIVVELKVAPELTKLHKAQTISYIKVVGKRDGLLLNFGGTQPAFHRLFYNEPEQPPTEGTIRKKVREMAGPYAPELVYEINAALFEVFRHLGPGFIQRIYANSYFAVSLRSRTANSRSSTRASPLAPPPSNTYRSPTSCSSLSPAPTRTPYPSRS